jgi:hypothetical protein
MALSRATQRVFLDLPGFLTSDGIFEDEARIIQSLNRAGEVRRYLREPINFSRPQALTAYQTSIPSVNGRPDRSFIADLGNIRTMFVDLKVGDLVIMTPSNHYDSLLIGEVKSEWSIDHVMDMPENEEYGLPFREVSWLSHDLTRRDFPARVAQRLQNRKAITRVDSDYYEPILRLIYHAYIWGNTSKIDIFAPSYDSNDPTSTAEASALIKYAVALAIALEKNELNAFYDLTIDDAVNAYFDPLFVIQISQSFGSPGGYIARLVGTAAAIAAGAAVALALHDEGQPVAQARQHIAAQVELAASQPGADKERLEQLGQSLRAGKNHDVQARYGRAAKVKLGLTLQGKTPPEITAPDRVRP